MKPSIRLAGLGDVDVLGELNAEVHALHVTSRPDQFKASQPEEIREWFRQLLLNASARVWLAELDQLAVGYAAAITYARPEGPFCPARTWWELDQIGVRAAHRGRGVGRALVEKVVQEAQSAGVWELELNSWAFNQSAHDAFCSFGFVPKVVRFELRPSQYAPQTSVDRQRNTK